MFMMGNDLDESCQAEPGTRAPDPAHRDGLGGRPVLQAGPAAAAAAAVTGRGGTGRDRGSHAMMRLLVPQ